VGFSPSVRPTNMLETSASKFPAFDPAMWGSRERGGYGSLGWVHAQGPLQELLRQAHLQGHETVVDLGTGTRAILDSLTPHIATGKLLGFDISHAMLTSGQRHDRHGLFQADACHIPLPDNSTDIVTARMVFHHLPDIPGTISEIRRILKPGGKAIIGEYVAVDEEVLAFERVVFDIKEQGRHLWTGPQMAQLIANHWSHSRPEAIVLGYGVMLQYSVMDWMGKSGLSEKIQSQVLSLYLTAQASIVEKMGITYSENGDALVNRPFAFVRATK
jgi:SAM-dependent methyltransferase